MTLQQVPQPTTEALPANNRWDAPGSLQSASQPAAANRMYYRDIYIPKSCVLTGIAYLVGTTSSGNVKAGLYSATASKLAETTATVAQVAANTYQEVSFSAPYSTSAGTYFLALLFSSATSTSYAGYTTNRAALGDQASFTLPASFTVPTSGAYGLIVSPGMTTF